MFCVIANELLFVYGQFDTSDISLRFAFGEYNLELFACMNTSLVRHCDFVLEVCAVLWLVCRGCLMEENK